MYVNTSILISPVRSITCYQFLLILILCLVVCLFKSSRKVFNLADFNVYTSNFLVGADTFYLFFNILLSCPIPILEVLSIRLSLLVKRAPALTCPSLTLRLTHRWSSGITVKSPLWLNTWFRTLTVNYNILWGSPSLSSYILLSRTLAITMWIFYGYQEPKIMAARKLLANAIKKT